MFYFFFFFFQAEDGIRDDLVTGVQTCALPISREALAPVGAVRETTSEVLWRELGPILDEEIDRLPEKYRSEERRVGKECRSRWWAYHEKKKKKRREMNKYARK